MLFYRHTGTADGSPSWPVQAKKIGNGWNFRQVIAGAGSAPPGLEPPREEQLPVVNETCQRFASRAVEQYQKTVDRPKCRVPSDARWQANYQNHYNWCLTAQPGRLRSEEKARDDHLYRCGAQIRID
jgi:hypothetical protein